MNFNELNTGTPAIIKKVDVRNQTVSVQLSYKLTYSYFGEVKSLDIPEIDNVPYFTLQNKYFCISIPPEVGDTCFVHFSQRSVKRFFETGEIQETDGSMHDINDAFAIVGFNTKNQLISNVKSEELSIRTKTQSGYLNIGKDGGITIGNSAGYSISLSSDGTVTINSKAIQLNSESINISGKVNIRGEANVDGTLRVTGDIDAKTINGKPPKSVASRLLTFGEGEPTPALLTSGKLDYFDSFKGKLPNNTLYFSIKYGESNELVEAEIDLTYINSYVDMVSALNSKLKAVVVSVEENLFIQTIESGLKKGKLSYLLPQTTGGTAGTLTTGELGSFKNFKKSCANFGLKFKVIVGGIFQDVKIKYFGDGPLEKGINECISFEEMVENFKYSNNYLKIYTNDNKIVFESKNTGSILGNIGFLQKTDSFEEKAILSSGVLMNFFDFFDLFHEQKQKVGKNGVPLVDSYGNPIMEDFFFDFAMYVKVKNKGFEAEDILFYIKREEMLDFIGWGDFAKLLNNISNDFAEVVFEDNKLKISSKQAGKGNEIGFATEFLNSTSPTKGNLTTSSFLLLNIAIACLASVGTSDDNGEIPVKDAEKSYLSFSLKSFKEEESSEGIKHIFKFSYKSFFDAVFVSWKIGDGAEKIEYAFRDNTDIGKNLSALLVNSLLVENSGDANIDLICYFHSESSTDQSLSLFRIEFSTKGEGALAGYIGYLENENITPSEGEFYLGNVAALFFGTKELASSLVQGEDAILKKNIKEGCAAYLKLTYSEGGEIQNGEDNIYLENSALIMCGTQSTGAIIKQGEDGSITNDTPTFLKCTKQTGAVLVQGTDDGNSWGEDYDGCFTLDGNLRVTENIFFNNAEGETVSAKSISTEKIKPLNENIMVEGTVVADKLSTANFQARESSSLNGTTAINNGLKLTGDANIDSGSIKSKGIEISFKDDGVNIDNNLKANDLYVK